MLCNILNLDFDLLGLYTSETLVNTSNITQHMNPENQHLNLHCHENHKSNILNC